MKISLFGKEAEKQIKKLEEEEKKEKLGECSNCNTEKVLIKHNLCRRCRLKEYDKLVEKNE